MKKAIVPIDLGLLGDVLMLPSGVKVRLTHFDPRYPEMIKLILEGDGLPDSCLVDGPDDCVRELRPTYRMTRSCLFEGWGE